MNKPEIGEVVVVVFLVCFKKIKYAFKLQFFYLVKHGGEYIMIQAFLSHWIN